MFRYKYLQAIVFFLSLLSCEEHSNQYNYVDAENRISIKLEQLTDSTSSLNLYLNDNIHSKWRLEYPVYRVDFGDVDKDGVVDILVGVTKTTRFDPHLAKRLFIFKVTKDYYIRPKWLGSRLGQPLEDFRFVNIDSQPIIRSIEKEKDGTYLVAEYRWRSFGLEFIKYIQKNNTLGKAQVIMNK